ncbi:MAG TPA: hypothetical protein VG734_05700 [Lacunisphaera sp.]|nr:hypothetical protein [Lacunisphaera sp.]
MMLPPDRRHRAVALCILSLAVARAAAVELEPIPPGEFAVATTHFAVREQADAKAMFAFLNGKVSATGTQYLTDILVHPEAVPTVQVEVPADAALYGAQAGTRLPLVLLVAYPTTRDNPRAGYKFPYRETGDALFTHMQQPGDKPLFANSTAKYPLILLSGGYNTHSLWHLSHMKALAAHGYIVADMLHGDGRGTSFPSNLALRCLQVRATLDFLLRDRDFGPAIDPARIGITGESAGGHTAAAALGGVDSAGRIPAGAEARIKAGFGLVPFFGASFGIWPFKQELWYFGEDHAGLRRVDRPFMAVYGADDSNVPPEGVEAALRAMGGPATAIMLDGEKHLVSDAAAGDIRTWEILFFNAWLRGDATARQQLAAASSVRGGVNDHVTIRRP